ncbi:MAG: hypothetical protein V7751_00170 [Pseudoalteromonas distincta]
MTHELNFNITVNGAITEAVRGHGFNEFQAFAEYIHNLPYGRPDCAQDILAVLKEGRGTCSVKHRLLAAVADECGHPEVELVVGLYAMSEQNTPGVGTTLKAAGFAWIPEAHCYLQVRDRRYDFTGLTSGTDSPFDALLSEHPAHWLDLPDQKSRLHQQAMALWATANALAFDDAWRLREACIQSLADRSKSKTHA